MQARDVEERVGAIVGIETRGMSPDALGEVASALKLLVRTSEKALRIVNKAGESWPVDSLAVWALSTAQRIWNSRQPTEDPDEQTTHLVLRRTHSALCVDTNGQPMLRRSYSALCAEEFGVPIAVVKKVLIVEGREESATPRVLGVPADLGIKGCSLVFDERRSKNEVFIRRP